MLRGISFSAPSQGAACSSHAAKKDVWQCRQPCSFVQHCKFRLKTSCMTCMALQIQQNLHLSVRLSHHPCAEPFLGCLFPILIHSGDLSGFRTPEYVRLSHYPHAESFPGCLFPVLTLMTCLPSGRRSTCLRSCYTTARMAQIRRMTPEARMYGLLV